MAKPKTEINPKSRLRVQQLLIEHGMNQAWLQEQMGLSGTSMSKIMTGKAPLTEKRAKQIAEIFPDADVRYEWLMGYDDCKTNGEWANNRKKEESKKLLNKLKRDLEFFAEPAERLFEKHSEKIYRLWLFFQMYGYDTDPAIDGLVSDDLVNEVESADDMIQKIMPGLTHSMWDEMDKVYEDQIFTLYQVVKGTKRTPPGKVIADGKNVSLKEVGQISGSELLQFAEELEDYAGILEKRLLRRVEVNEDEQNEIEFDPNENETEEST